jgi:serine/threonine-protein kinase
VLLERACATDPALRREVESRLGAHDGASGFLSRPAMDDVRPGSADTALAARLAVALADRYELERELGRGGMATVYLARDVRHHRQVAVKVLLPELAVVLGADRFLAEIRTTAALQHPHIVPLFDSGEAAGQLYYVMPYVPGETLCARLTRERQLPVDEALRIVSEVASALDYAYRHGVIHRDVKPENILLDEEAQALVTDFGIALAVRHAAGERLTQSGLSLGTPQYMAPEQAAGEQAVDARADVYALGAVTYEMLAGRPPFTGASAQAVIAKLMTEEPPALSSERRSVPSHVEAAVTRALAKVPADRFATASAFAAALAEPSAPRDGMWPRMSTRGARRLQLSLPVAASLGVGLLAAGVALGVTLGGTSLAPAASTATRGRVQFVIEADSGVTGSVVASDSPPALAPDGGTVVFAANGPGGGLLYARRLDELTARPIVGTEGAGWPFFSPDGAWVGFASRGAIRKVRLAGGTPVIVTELPPSVGAFQGGHWGRDDVIVFTAWTSGALYRVSAAGGTPARIAVADTTQRLMYPSPLPDGRALLVTASTDWLVGRVAVLDLATGRLRRFGPGTGTRYVAGYLVYAGASGELFRQPFDLERLAPSGPAEEIASGLAVGFAMHSPFDAAEGGAVVYRVGRGSWDLKVTDRTGRAQQVLPGRFPWSPRFSPDGRRVVYAAFPPGQESSDVWSGGSWRLDLWVAELASGEMRRLTTAMTNTNPVWSPDGRSIAYDAGVMGDMDLFVRPLDGDSARRLARRLGNQWAKDWTPDGSGVFFEDARPTDLDLWIQPLDGGAARPYLTGPGNQEDARVSRDGRWVAYTSSATGHAEVYVQSYSTLGRTMIVSTGGGVAPVWRRDGQELYYWQGDQLIAARLEAGGGAGELPVVRGRTPLFRASVINKLYDVSPDGTQFVIVTGGARVTKLVIALDSVGAGRSHTRLGR